jgi:hypothetical protein
MLEYNFRQIAFLYSAVPVTAIFIASALALGLLRRLSSRDR